MSANLMPDDDVIPLDAYRDEQAVRINGAIAPDSLTLQDFYAYMPGHEYLFVPNRELWPAASINSRLPPVPAGIDERGKPKTIKPGAWLDANRPVDQMTWAPGLPMIIENKLVSGGGWLEREGSNTFNLYLPPTLALGDASLVDPWLDHIHEVYPADAIHLLKWLAHRVQRPGEKINHALVLGGTQGIGKDTILEPVKYAVGPWNFVEVLPPHLLGRFNGFAKSVILRVSEARDLGDIDRYGFYEHLKTYTAAPPDVLRCDEKNLREHAVINVCGVIVTSNHKTEGIYLPADDRRHYVAWSSRSKESFTEDYWRTLYRWYADGGNGHVAAYLAALDLTGFDPKAPPPKTPAFWDIVDANRAPEDGELADVLELLGQRDAITLSDLASRATDDEFCAWLQDRKNRRQIPHRLESAGYIPFRNSSATDGLWKLNGKRQSVYVKKSLTVRDQHLAVSKLMRQAGV